MLNFSFLPTFLQQVYEEVWTNEVFGRAAQMAYYWLFSLFPLLIFFTALASKLQTPTLTDSLLEYLQTALPPNAYVIVSSTVAQLAQRQTGLASFGLLVALWSASAGMESIIIGLNKAYHVPSGRPWWREKVLSIILTVGMAIFVLIALVMLFFGGTIGNYLAPFIGTGQELGWGWTLIRWGAVVVFTFTALSLIYFFAPNIRHHWRSTIPGAVFALTVWLLLSNLFKFYVIRFSNYDAMYGTLGGVMVLMLWFYLTFVAVLLGGIINWVLLRANESAAAALVQTSATNSTATPTASTTSLS